MGRLRPAAISSNRPKETMPIAIQRAPFSIPICETAKEKQTFTRLFLQRKNGTDLFFA